MTRPIPDAYSLKNWKAIKIEECGEKLLSVRSLHSKFIKSSPQYFAQGLPGSKEDCYVRETVADKLLEAAVNLPKGFQFLIYDGWRPYKVQEALFEKFYRMLVKEHPSYSAEKVHELTTKYVSEPSLNPLYPAPHITGGAVDLTLINEWGDSIEMGTHFDDFSEQAATRYYEKLEETGNQLTLKEEEILTNRRLLYHLLTSVGFANYQNEWWHFDYGNQWWAHQTAQSEAKYGLIREIV